MKSDGVVDVLRQLGCDKIRFSGGNVKSCCPMAPYMHEGGQDKHPSFSVKADDNGPSKYVCFTCRTRGNSLTGLFHDLKRAGASFPPDLFAKVSEVETVSINRRYINFGDVFGRNVFVEKAKEEADVWAEKDLEKYLGATHRYIIDRGVRIDTCRTFELGYDPVKKVVIFPVRRKDGALVGAMCRSIVDNTDPKYRVYLPFNKSKFLYGEHLLIPQGEATLGDIFEYENPAQEGIIVVEGMMDVFKLYQLGFDNVVGVMTALLSEQQLSKLRSNGRPIYLMFDWDKAGYEGRASAIKKLLGRQLVYDVPGVTRCYHCGSDTPRITDKGPKKIMSCVKCHEPWAVDPKKKDPDQLTDEEILECLKNAKRLSV